MIINNIGPSKLIKILFKQLNYLKCIYHKIENFKMMLIDEYNASYMYMYKLINQLTSDCNTFQNVFEN